MGEWPQVALGDLVVNFDGRRIPVKEAERRPGPYPYYGASGVVDHVDDFLFDGTYLLVAEDGENLRSRKTPVAFLGTGRFWVNNHAHVLQANERADTRYLAYALARAEIGGYLSGSTMPKLTQANLHQIPVPAPPLAEQRRIVGILGAFDDKIELNLRTSETMEGTAQALFKSWFLDSEPDASDQNGSLADAVDLLRDLVHPQLEPDTVFQHYSLPAYDAGREAISEPGAGIRSSKLAVPWGSVLLSKLNPEIERVWVPDIRPDDRAICSTEFLVVRPRADVGQAFVYEFLRSAPFRSTLTSLVTGTTGSHQRANAEAILQVPLRLPGPSRAANFERLVGPVLDRVAVARRESQTLVALRDALLPRLLSGETSPSLARAHET